MKLFKWCIPVFLCLSFAGVQAQDYTLDKKDTSEVRLINKKKFYIYKVEKGETIYSLGRKFSVTEAELLEFNPDLKDGLKHKMKLWIPAASGLVTAPVAEEKKTEPSRDSSIEITLFAPLHIDKHYVTEELPEDTLLLNEWLDKETAASLEFYEGMLFALEETAKSKKVKVRLRICDTKDDSAVTLKWLRGASVQKSDVWIAAGGNGIQKLINQHSRIHKVPLVSAEMNSTENLRDNPGSVAFLPASLTQCQQMGKASSRLFKGAQCTLIKSSNAKETERSKAFKAGWLEEDKTVVIKEISLGTTMETVLQDSLSSSRPNVLFVPSSNEDFVSQVITALDKIGEEKKFYLVGIPTWQYFETINPSLMEKMNTYLFVTSFIDYESSMALQLRKHFRETYGNEPSENAYLGFDVMTVLEKAWLSYGREFPGKLHEEDYSGLYSHYHFSTHSGMTENGFIQVLRYKDVNLEKVDAFTN